MYVFLEHGVPSLFAIYYPSISTYENTNTYLLSLDYIYYPIQCYIILGTDSPKQYLQQIARLVAVRLMTKETPSILRNIVNIDHRVMQVIIPLSFPSEILALFPGPRSTCAYCQDSTE